MSQMFAKMLMSTSPNRQDELSAIVSRRWLQWVGCVQRSLHHRTPQAAEDIVQTALLKAFKHLDGFREDAKLDSWVMAIILNQLRLYFREKTERYLHVELKDNDLILDGEKQAYRARMFKEALPVIERIRPKHRDAIVRHFFLEEDPIKGQVLKMRRHKGLLEIRKRMGLMAA